MSKSRVGWGALALTTAAVLGTGGASAWAAVPATTPQSLSTVQAEAAAAISLRVDDLNAAIAKVDGAKDLGSDAATLAAYLRSDIAPLQALGVKIAGDSSVTTATNDAVTIFTNFRVLALVIPAARVAAAADVVDVTAIPKLTAFATAAEARVNPSNQATVQPLIDDLNAQVRNMNTATSGLAATVLGYTPAQWNANHDILGPSVGSARAAAGNVAQARADVAKIRAILKPTGAAPTT
jgi:hypothetical protein